jgi:Zn-dependent protease with chaperone function
MGERMRFVARAPREDVNVSPEHPLAEAATLIAGLAAVLVAITAFIVFFVDIVVMFIPPKAEADIFAKMNMSSFGAARVQSAPELQKLADRLLRHWPDSPYRLTVKVLEEKRPNALALPGGTILVTRGLLDSVGSENELAFVLAHEIGHFRNRDHLRQFGRGFALGLVWLAVGGSNSDLVTTGVLEGTMRSFGRRQELAADRVALQIAQAEYGHVAEALRFLQRHAEGESALRNVAAYFTTHPAPADRIEALRRIAADNGWPMTGEFKGLAD